MPRFPSLLLRFLLVSALVPANVLQAANSSPSPAEATAPTAKSRHFSVAEIDQLTAPIALYPDALVSQILMSATDPLDVVLAARWLEEPNNAGLKGEELVAALDEKEWDPSAKALVPFPAILKMMNDHLEWTQRLGEAVVADEKRVLDSVQRLRRQARAAGSLQSNDKQTVRVVERFIYIEPASPDIVYFPYYDPFVVFGHWRHPHYRPYDWGPPFGYGYYDGIGFVGGFLIVAPLWGWSRCDWHRHHIFVDVPRYRRIDGHRRVINSPVWQPLPQRGLAERLTGGKLKMQAPGSQGLSLQPRAPLTLPEQSPGAGSLEPPAENLAPAPAPSLTPPPAPSPTIIPAPGEQPTTPSPEPSPTITPLAPSPEPSPTLIPSPGETGAPEPPEPSPSIVPAPAERPAPPSSEPSPTVIPSPESRPTPPAPEPTPPAPLAPEPAPAPKPEPSPTIIPSPESRPTPPSPPAHPAPEPGPPPRTEPSPTVVPAPAPPTPHETPPPAPPAQASPPSPAPEHPSKPDVPEHPSKSDMPEPHSSGTPGAEHGKAKP